MAKLSSGSISIVMSLSLTSMMDEGRLGRLWRPPTTVAVCLPVVVLWWCEDDDDDGGEGEGREVERSAAVMVLPVEGLRGSGGGTARRRWWMRYRVLRCAFSSTLADTPGMRAISVERSAAAA